MSTHNIGFYEEMVIIIFQLSSKYHQLRTLSAVLLVNFKLQTFIRLTVHNTSENWITTSAKTLSQV